MWRCPGLSHTSDKTCPVCVPQTIIYADNQPFNSRAFINFANSWGITVTTSSPGFPQSNSQAEIYVSIVKQLMKKAEDSGKDRYIALLEYRNTPGSGMKHSPAQLAMSRMLRSKLPTRADLLKPQVVDPSGTAAVLRDRQIQYKSAYDRKAGPPLTSLQPGDVVRHRRNGVWEPAIVTSKHGSPRGNRLNLTRWPNIPLLQTQVTPTNTQTYLQRSLPAVDRSSFPRSTMILLCQPVEFILMYTELPQGDAVCISVNVPYFPCNVILFKQSYATVWSHLPVRISG